MKRRKKFMYGGIPHPNEAIYRDNLGMAKAEQASSNNGWVNGLNMLGSFLLEQGLDIGMQGLNKGLFPAAKGAKTYAYGGKVPVEVEGGETAETPFGQLLQFNGAKHSQGGIDVNLPAGTNIFSDRIKIGGITMADRKKIREKKEQRINTLLSKNFTDKVLRNTLDRLKRNNVKEEQSDMAIQNYVGSLKGGNKYAYGGFVSPLQEKPKSASFGDVYRRFIVPYLLGYRYSPEYGKDLSDKLRKVGSGAYSKEAEAAFNAPFVSPMQNRPKNTFSYGLYPSTAKEAAFRVPFVSPMQNRPKNTFSYGLYPSTAKEAAFRVPFVSPMQNTPKKKAVNDENSYWSTLFTEGGKRLLKGLGSLGENIVGDIKDVSFGDMLGMYGAYNTSNNLQNNLLENRAGDQPHINYYKDYGKKGLESLNKAKSYLTKQRDFSKKQIDSYRNSLMDRNRNSARGINTMRALDLSTALMANNEKQKTDNAFNNQMLSLQNALANAQMQRDRMVMTGEEKRDMSNRADRDNYYSEKAKNIITRGLMLQNLAKALNSQKLNKLAMRLLSENSRYGKKFKK